MSDDKTQAAISRGARAKAILTDELFSGSLIELENAYIKAWRETGVRDTDARERLWQAVQVVGKVRDHLSYMIGDGRLAQAELDALIAAQPKAA
jgi:hypothetical protein